MSITAAQLQTALGVGAAQKMGVEVLREFGTFGTKQHWYIRGGATYPGRCKFVETTASDNAATQATSVLTAMNASPSF